MSAEGGGRGRGRRNRNRKGKGGGRGRGEGGESDQPTNLGLGLGRGDGGAGAGAGAGASVGVSSWGQAPKAAEEPGAPGAARGFSQALAELQEQARQHAREYADALAQARNKVPGTQPQTTPHQSQPRAPAQAKPQPQAQPQAQAKPQPQAQPQPQAAVAKADFPALPPTSPARAPLKIVFKSGDGQRTVSLPTSQAEDGAGERARAESQASEGSSRESGRRRGRGGKGRKGKGEKGDDEAPRGGGGGEQEEGEGRRRSKKEYKPQTRSGSRVQSGTSGGGSGGAQSGSRASGRAKDNGADIPDVLPHMALSQNIITRTRWWAMEARQKMLVQSKQVRCTRNTLRVGGVSMEVVDGKTNTGGRDDEVYERSFSARPPRFSPWEGQARGQTSVRINGRLVCLLMGLRKFGGEEDAYTTQVRDTEEIVRETYSRKENGECFHLAGFEHNGQFYYVGGSKNVHGVVRAGRHMLHDVRDHKQQRYSFFREMFELWAKVEARLTNVQRKALQRYLATTGHTFVAESCMLEHQHLVDYKQDTLFFFAISHVAHSALGLTALVPDDARRVFLAFGLDVVADQTSVDINSPQRAQLRDKFRYEDNSEGAVVYVWCKHEKTGAMRVCRVYKYKNDDYVFRRAIREQMRRKADSSKIKARIRKLHIRHRQHELMTQRGLQFNAWCRLRNDQGKLDWDWLFSHWMTVEKEFESVPEAERRQVLQSFDKRSNVFVPAQPTHQQVHMFAMGTPGTGKSTTWRILEKILPGFQRVNQDDFGGDPKKYHAQIKRLSAPDSRVKGILIDKCNHDTRVRGNAYQALQVFGRRVFVLFLHPDDADEELDKTIALAFNRIYHRGLAHTTLHPNQKLPGILEGFARSWEGLSDEERRNAALIVRVDITMPLEGMVQTVLDALKDENLLPVSRSDDEWASLSSAAIADVLAQERSLHKANAANKRTVYWSALLDEEAYNEAVNHPVVRAHLASRPELVLQKALHCTLLFLGGKPPQGDADKAIEQHWLERENQAVVLSVETIEFDAKACALRLCKDIPCQNAVPHLSLALVSGIPPKYSNEMLGHPQGSHKCPMQLSARVTRVFS